MSMEDANAGWVLNSISEETEPDPQADQMVPSALWTNEGRILDDAKKDTNDWEVSKAKRALDRLENEGKILRWHGQATLATEEYVQAIVAHENNSDLPRTILIEKAVEVRE